MAQKNATPTREQQEYISECGLQPMMWVVVKERRYTLIIRHRLTGEFKRIKK